MHIDREEKDMNIYLPTVRRTCIKTMNYLSNKSTVSCICYSFFLIEEMLELLDLPDEMILAIFNEIKPEIFLLSSIIGIGNNRLEHLALTNCYSLDLTFDYYHPLDATPVQRFYLFILPKISNHIRSLSLNLRHLIHVNTIVRYYINQMTFSLTHFKIILFRYHRGSGKCFEIGKLFI